jgi:hypothetical protein
MSRQRSSVRWPWLAALVVACGGPTFVVQQYAGPPQPREVIAIVRVNGGGPRVVALDREALVVPEKGTRFHIEVIPGVHELHVDDPGLGIAGLGLRFVTEPDKVYRVVVRATSTPGSPVPLSVPQVFEVDRETDAELRPAAPVNDTPPPPPPSVPLAADAGARD